jgi:hypothetical protein
MKQKAQVLMLPTEKASNMLKVLTDKMEHRGRMKDSLELHDSAWEKSTDFQPQHLYFTTDEEIKDGNWVILPFIGLAQFTPENRVAKSNGYKIVATTNPDLWITKKFSHYSQDLMKVAVYKDVSTGIAKIPTDFIEAYVGEQGKITEVMLEYEEGQDYLAGGSGDNEIWAKYPDKLKLRNNSTVIVHPVQERVWNDEQLKNRIFEFVQYMDRNDMTGTLRQTIEQWFEENYPQ